MKKILLPILALGGLLLASSCQMDEPDSGTLTGEVYFSIIAGIPSGIITYSPTDGNAFSHLGGANNVDATQYDLRYILEVYDGETLAYRDVQYVDEGFTDSKASFSARLLAKSYTFVLWADFVENGSTSDLYYNAESLKEISYKTTNTADLTKDEIDAYTAKKVIDLSKNSKNESITLQRPFGKIRLLATDKDIVNNDPETPVSVKLNFGSAKFPSSFNALTGDVTGEFAVNAVATFPVEEDAQSVDGATKYEGAYLLGYIYAFASTPQAAYPIDVTVYSDADAANQIGHRELTGIPVSANKLTTVIGNFYSNEGNLEVIVEDKFGNGEEEIPLPDAVSASSLDELKRLLADPDIDAIALTSDMEITETINVNRAVLLTGGAIITTSGGNPVFTLSAEGAAIDGLKFYQSYNDSQSIIKVTAKNCEIRNCTFEGQYRDGNTETTRAILPNAGVAVTVEGNTFKNIRQPGYFQGDGVVLRNNYVEGTRGFVVCANNEITLEGNTFGENAVDIAIIANGADESTYKKEFYDDVRTLSEKNNGAFVENQYSKASAVGNGNSKALSDALKNATTIELLAGTFELSDGITIPEGTTVNGSSRDEVRLSMAEHDGDSWAVTLAGTLKNVYVIYDTERGAGTAWTTNPGGVLFNAGGHLEGCRVAYFRNGLYANNIDGITISNNIVDANRTGIQFANAVGATVTGNTFSNNETMGVLLQDLYPTGEDAKSIIVEDNVFDGNWYSDFENRWATEYPVDLSDNTFTEGSTVLKVQPSTGEPGGSETFTKPASQVANIVTALASNIEGDKFFPIRDDGGNVYGNLQDAINNAEDNAVITIKAGTLTENVRIVNGKNLTIQGANAGIDPNTQTRNDETVIVGTINTHFEGNNTDFNKDQTLTIDGITFAGATYTIGSMSTSGYETYNGVGNVVVKNCILQNSNKENLRLVHLRNDATDDKRVNVTLENNRINAASIGTIWSAMNVTIKGNYFAGNENSSMSISKISEKSLITITGNTFENLSSGVYVTSWNMGNGPDWSNEVFKGSITVTGNTFINVGGDYDYCVPVFISPDWDTENDTAQPNNGIFKAENINVSSNTYKDCTENDNKIRTQE